MEPKIYGKAGWFLGLVDIVAPLARLRLVSLLFMSEYIVQERIKDTGVGIVLAKERVLRIL